MAGRGWVKAAWGCGGGCLLVIVLGVVGIVVLTQQTTSGFEKALDSGGALEGAYPTVETFVPPALPDLPRQRLEAFVAVREAAQPQRQRVAKFFENLDPEKLESMEDEDFGQKMKSIGGLVGGSFRFGADMGNFFAARNAAMGEQGMGRGEYAYYYALVYFSWLGKPPGQQIGEVNPMEMATFGSFARLRDGLRDMTLRQRESLPEDAPADWRVALDEEAERMAADPDRIPWQDGLPPQLEASLTPFRQQLEATYVGPFHGLELGRTRKRGAMSYTTEF